MRTRGCGAACGVVLALSGTADAAAQVVDPGARADDPAAVVLVSARKREEQLIDVPVAVTSFGSRDFDDLHITSFIDYAVLTPGLSFAYGNGGTAGNPATAFADARTVAIRGVAGARTTGVYLDDVPLPGAVDVRVVDVKSIEVLKGPQGTLYGEGSLGGNIRIESMPPDLRHDGGRAGLEAGRTHEGAGQAWSAQAALNAVLSPDVAALRVVLQADGEPGFLTRTYRAHIDDPASARVAVDGQGSLRNQAASTTLRLRPDPRAELTLRMLWRDQYRNGFPAPYAPLPGFRPVPVLDHVANVQPVATDVWSLPALTFGWHGDGWTLVSTLSRFQRHARDVEDTTEGTAAYWGTTIAQPFAWTGRHATRQLTHETRMTFDGARSNATAGLYWSDVRAQFDIDPIYGQLGSTPATPALLWVQQDVNRQRDAALFGEFDYRITPAVTGTVGLRRYWLRQEDDLGFSYLDTVFSSRNRNGARGVSPRLALAWRRAPDQLWYASASKGFRQGNAQFDPSGFGCDASLAAIGQNPSTMTRIAPDAVWSYEAGGRLALDGGHTLLSAALYRIDWQRIQQPIFLPSCAFYMQGNAGAARIEGAELELQGTPARGWRVRAGLGYTRALITAEGNTGQHVGDPVYQVPRLTMSTGFIWSAAAGAAWTGFVAGDASYTGSSVSANSGADLQLVRAPYRLLNVRFGVRNAVSELALNVRNAGDARPNLGDIGYLGYQRFVPGTTTPLPQVATLAPRTITLQYVRHW